MPAPALYQIWRHFLYSPEKDVYKRQLILFPFFTLFCTAARIAFLCSQEECTSLRKKYKNISEKKKSGEEKTS